MSEEQPTLTGALGNANRLKLGTFSTNLWHGGAISTAPGLLPITWDAVRGVAVQADRMGLELLVPVARWKGFGGKTNFGGPSFETLTWAAGLAEATEHACVFATCHVPIVHPILAAKQLMVIDHISGGRCGVNIVGGWHRNEIEMFGVALLEHDDRYEMAEEWVTVVRDLWTRDGEFDFDGRYFQLKGAYAEPKPVQKPRMPIMNAGGSPRGQRFAAEFGDLAYIFLRDTTNLEGARKTVAGYKRLASEEFGRTLQVWTNATVIIADTEAEARAYDRRVFEELADNEAVDSLLRTMGIESAVLGDQAEAVRKRFVTGWGGVPLCGTPEQVAEGLTFISEAGLDGCLLLFAEWEEGLDRFRDQVLPLLERAGLRERYEPTS